MKLKEYKCINCGTHYYYEIRYKGAKQYCHTCYLKRRRIYEQKRKNRLNTIIDSRGEIYWPHVNNKSKIFETGMFGYSGNIQRQSTNNKHEKS